MPQIVIKAENISKAYQLGQIGTGTLSRDLERFWARLRGKDDPFLKIGEVNDRATKSKSNIVWGLKDINFEIEQGSAVGIIGNNGAGKSTLLKVLSRVTAPTTGSLKIRGRIASLLEVGTGFHPELTGRENIYLNGSIMGMRKADIKRRFDEIVDFSGVERYIDTPVKRYSSGMYVRLAFAVAAHLESETLLIDEVLAVGDAEFQKKCLGKMNDVSKGEGRTILFVSHNMDSIKKLCNSGILLNKGTIKYTGGIDEAIDDYLLVTKTDVIQTRLINFPLNKHVSIDLFEVSKVEVTSHQDIDFCLRLSSDQINYIESLVIMIYDEMDQKIGFIDLRSNELSQLSADHTKIEIIGRLKSLPLLPGNYKIELLIQSVLLHSVFTNLLQFRVLQKTLTDDVFPYPVHARGKVEIDYDFSINKQ